MNGPSGSTVEIRPVTWKIGLAALIVSFFWSGNIISIKFGLETIPPIWSAFWRMSLGAVCVTGWALAKGQPVLFERARLRQLLLLGVVFTSQIAIFNLSVHYTSPAYAVILLNTNPVMINLISHFFMKDDRLTFARLAGLGIAFCGISYVMFGHPEAQLAPNPLLGNSLMLVSSLLLAVRVVYTQHVVRTMDPLRPVIWPMVFHSVLLRPGAPHRASIAPAPDRRACLRDPVPGARGGGVLLRGLDDVVAASQRWQPVGV